MRPETRAYLLVNLVVLLFVALTILSGCTLAHDAFTNPTGNITIPRKDFLNAYARVRELYLTIHSQAEQACRMNLIEAAKCLRIAEVHQEAKALDFEVRAKVAVPETTLDWAMIEKVLGFAVKLVL